MSFFLFPCVSVGLFVCLPYVSMCVCLSAVNEMSLWWKGWLCHLNLGTAESGWRLDWQNHSVFVALDNVGWQRRPVQILHSTFTQHLIWTPQSTPTKDHSFSDLCISGHFWRRQRRVCYGGVQNRYLCDTLFTSNRIQEEAKNSLSIVAGPP